MKAARVVFCTLAVTLCAYGADTKPLKTMGGECVISVPADWTTNSYGGAESPDKKVSIAMSSPKHGLTTLAQVKQLAPTIYKDDKVIKDSSSEFEMAGNSLNGKPNVYRAIPAGDHVCIVELIYENDDQAAEKATVQTMKPAK